jgi:hypothetical protein
MNPKCSTLMAVALGFLAYGFDARSKLPAQSTVPECTSPAQRLADHSGAGWNNSENSWRLTACDLKSQVDEVNPILRAQRNAYWRPILKGEYDSYKTTTSHAQPIGGSFVREASEFSDADGSVWVMATFESFRVFAIDPDYHFLYTEMSFRINDVIRAPDNLNLSAGMLIDSDIPGGKVKTPEGNAISSEPPISPGSYYPQPGHRYLLRLLPVPKGNFLSVNRQWDLSTGSVQPDDLPGIDRAARDDSAIKGMSEGELINYLQTALPAEPKK